MAFSLHAQDVLGKQKEDQLKTFYGGYKILKDISDCPTAIELMNRSIERFAIGSMGSTFSDCFEFKGVMLKVAASFGYNPVTKETCELYLDVCATKDL